jgi:hypothetical protein
VFIEDTKVAPGISHNITNQAYNFSYILADSPMRFVLHYINTAFGVDENLTTAWSTTGWFDSQTNLVVNFAGTNLPSTVKIIVFDLAGKKLYASNNVETNSAFAIENNFTAGIYLLTVVGSNGESKVTKVVKSK